MDRDVYIERAASDLVLEVFSTASATTEDEDASFRDEARRYAVEYGWLELAWLNEQLRDAREQREHAGTFPRLIELTRQIARLECRREALREQVRRCSRA